MIWQSELLFPSHINNWRIVQLRNVEIIIIEIMFIFFKVFELTELLHILYYYYIKKQFLQKFSRKTNLQCFSSTSKDASHFLVKKGKLFPIISPLKNVVIEGSVSVSPNIFKQPHIYDCSQLM